jgi:hypothetical protein
VVIDTKAGCAAGGWMDVDVRGREEEEEEKRGKGRVLFSLGEVVRLSLATGRVGTKQY